MKVIQAKFAQPILIGKNNFASVTLNRPEFSDWEMSFDKGLLVIYVPASPRAGTDGKSCWIVGLSNIAFMKILSADNPHLAKETESGKTPPETSITKLPRKAATKSGKGSKSSKS